MRSRADSIPAGASLHNCMNGHGPDAATYARAVSRELKPEKIVDTMAFMFETRHVIRPTRWAMETPLRQAGLRPGVVRIRTRESSLDGRHRLDARS